MGIAIPIGSAVLMLVPAVVMRFLRPTRESLDGFVIGALGAICFTAAATLTRLAPQFATGVIAGDRPASVLLVQAGLQGVAVPLTAAALGGLVGAALWFGRRNLLVCRACWVPSLYSACLGLMEVAPVLQGLHLRRAPDDRRIRPAGLADWAADRSAPRGTRPAESERTRALPTLRPCRSRHGFLPELRGRRRGGVAHVANRAPGGCQRRSAATRPGYAVPAGSYEAAPVRHTTYRWLFTTIGRGHRRGGRGGGDRGGSGHAAETAVHVPARLRTSSDRSSRSTSNPRFVSADGEFSVQYPGPGSAYKATLTRTGSS